MRAARLHGPADLRIDEIPVPTPGPGEVLVRVRCYSPYGTCVGVYLNRGGRYVTEYPIGIGADFSAEIAALGPDVAGFAVGQRVTAQSLDNCGTCTNCSAGRTNLCLSPDLGRYVRQVCAQDYAIVSARKLCAMPDGVSDEAGAMITGVVDALNAFDKLGLPEGSPVAIVGVGAMGHGAIATARAIGLRPIAIGGRGAKADMAGELGAEHIFRIEAHNEDVSSAVLEAFSGGFAGVVETSATEWGMEQTFKVAAPGATIALTGGGALPVTNWDIVNREWHIVGVRGGPDQARALRLIAEGRLDLSPTISARIPLEQAADAFALLTGDKAKDVGRVIITIAD
ncbi:MAG: alcohol dehydrogenase catalytic domain-containing protein [Pseudomonadota bacterium]